MPSRLNFLILHIFLILEDITAIPNKKKRHIRKRGSIRGRFFKLLASHKLPKDDASQHNDLPKRDFSRVFLFNGGGVVRRKREGGSFTLIHIKTLDTFVMRC